MMKYTLSLCLVLGITLRAVAREDQSAQSEEAPYQVEMYDPHSVDPKPKCDVLYGKKICYRVVLPEKPNQGFFSPGSEITRWIIRGIQEDKLTPYADEELENVMTKEAFLERLKLPEEDTFGDDAEQTSDWDKAANNPEVKKKVKHEDYFEPREISIVELTINCFFDKRASKLCKAIESIKLIIPGKKFATGLSREVAVLKYKELAPYFYSVQAEWRHPDNRQQNLPLVEALDQWLWSGTIVKVENPKNERLEDIYGEDSLKAAESWVKKLEEQEVFLWKY